MAWASLPGWSEDNLSEIWPAFRAGCAALVNAPATRATWEAPCAASTNVAAGDTSKRIARKLGLHVKTVDSHRRLLRDKLGARSSAELIRLAKEHGLL